ncbi:PadR family transcriptional regulator [Thermopolyspora sp. NPDC052614]|uniref:PadR family transcriptional regulator n=1 Tax=Thermopolyspora sp. NPDC052614 TaxID=3155682 RepID=UPI003438008B
MTNAFSMGGAGINAPWPDPRALRRELKNLITTMTEAWGGHPGHGAAHERHEHRHRGPRGPRGFAWDFGPGPWGRSFMFGGGRPGWSRGRKAKRGDVRAAILALLSEEPRNGYQIIQEIAERSQGGWKPSPGAVYPALQQLTDEGLVRAEETDGRKTFHLTDAGRAYVAEHADDVRAPWEEMTPQVDDSAWEIMDLGRQTAAALFQVLQTGSDAQVRQAKQALAETRRKLYQILADGDPDEE